jgi:hypothetical protein
MHTKFTIRILQRTGPLLRTRCSFYANTKLDIKINLPRRGEFVSSDAVYGPLSRHSENSNKIRVLQKAEVSGIDKYYQLVKNDS